MYGYNDASVEEFKERMYEGIKKLQERLPAMAQGTPKSIILGVLRNTLTTFVTNDPVAGIALGTVLGSGFELIDRIIRRKAEHARVAGNNALILHFSALQGSDFVAPEGGQQEEWWGDEEEEWFNNLLKRLRERNAKE